MKRIVILILACVGLCCPGYAKKSDGKDSYAYKRGMEALNEADFETAVDWFQKELGENPKNGYASYYMGVINIFLGEMGDALSYMTDAIKNLPGKDKEQRAHAFGARSDVYLALEDTVPALKDLDEAIKLDAKNPTYLTDRAEIYYQWGDYDKADADYNRMSKEVPGNALPYVGLGRNEVERGNSGKAINYFTQAIKLSPDYSNAYAFRGVEYTKLGKWNEAADDLIKALDIDRSDKAFLQVCEFPEEGLDVLKVKLRVQRAKKPQEVYWPFLQGVIAYNEEKYEDAIELFNEANAISANITLLDWIADAYEEMDDYESALEIIEDAMNLTDDPSDLHQKKGDLLVLLGRFDEAIEQYDIQLSLDPEDPNMYLGRALANQKAGRHDKAVEDLKTAMIVAPLVDEISFMHSQMADSYRLSGNQGKASEEYNRAIEIGKNTEKGFDDFTALSYAGLGDRENALSMLNRTIENAEDKAEVFYNAACVYCRLGEPEKALDNLEKAVEEGYKRVGHIKFDYDFLSLHGNPRFEAIIKKLTPEKKAVKAKDVEGTYEYETVEVPFTKESGITKVKCDINDLPLYFYFDTGASDITLSMVEATFMMKNGYLTKDDVVGSNYYFDANGNVAEGTVINLKKVNFGGLELDNVRASVVRNQKAPLLLGQSVLGRLGKIEIDNSAQKLKITQKVKK